MNPQVTKAKLAALSASAPACLLASIQEDSLRSGYLPCSARCRTRRRRFSRLPGNRG